MQLPRFTFVGCLSPVPVARGKQQDEADKGRESVCVKKVSGGFLWTRGNRLSCAYIYVIMLYSHKVVSPRGKEKTPKGEAGNRSVNRTPGVSWPCKHTAVAGVRGGGGRPDGRPHI